MNARTTSLARQRNGRLILAAATLSVAALAAVAPAAAHAQSCHNVLQGHADWTINKPDGPGEYTLLFAIVSNSLTLNGTFIEGGLHRQIAGGSDVLAGPGTQYFSKRRFNPQKYPFNPNQTDPAWVSLNADTSRATLALSSGTYVFDLECDHLGVLYGHGNPQFALNLATPMFVISLRRSVTPSVD